MDSTIEKVSAFITRTGKQTPELLVFQHPSAGMQVPAGSVENGEMLEQALVREVFEESGLKDVSIIDKLGTQEQAATGERTVLMQATLLFKEPARTAPTIDLWLGRGWWVTVHQRRSDWSQVTYEDYDFTVSPPALISKTAGWLPTQLLATRVVRHFFHLETTTPTPDTWEHVAEDRYTFRFHWLPLEPRPQLVQGQNEWLELVYDRLIARDDPRA